MKEKEKESKHCQIMNKKENLIIANEEGKLTMPNLVRVS